MKMYKGGFTLIEVSLFLAITGLLFLGVTIGVQNSIFQQRYNDSVQSFAEFLRSAYTKVENVQGFANSGSGKSSKALYGKLVTFGESTNLAKESNDNDSVFIYDVIGNAKCNTGGLKDALSSMIICNAAVTSDNSQSLGMAESYTPRWSAAIQTDDLNNPGLFKGMLLITRHPQTGTMSTYVHFGEPLEINNGSVSEDTFGRKLAENGYFISTADVNFCVNPNGNETSNVGTRRNVRIKAGARNASAIEVVPDDENKCVKR